MSFNLSDAGEVKKGNDVVYQKPGVYENVIVSEVTLGSASTGSQYIQFKTLGANGEVGKSPQMYLNNEKKGDDKPTAWSITARNLRNYIVNTHNVTPEEAEAMMENLPNEQAIANKVSALLVGRKFRAKFKGVETSRGFIIAELAGSESMKTTKEDSKLSYNEVTDTVKYKGTQQTEQPKSMAPSESTSDLPF